MVAEVELAEKLGKSELVGKPVLKGGPDDVLDVAEVVTELVGEVLFTVYVRSRKAGPATVVLSETTELLFTTATYEMPVRFPGTVAVLLDRGMKR